MGRGRKKKSDGYLGVIFSLPALIYMMVFIGYPILQNFVLSFKNVDVYTFADKGAQKFVGFKNYIELMMGADSVLLFNKKFPGCSFFRGVTMISWLLPVTVAGLLFKFMFQLNGGIVNQFLISLHILDQPVEWLLNGNTAMIAIVIANIWIGIPFNMMLILTGLTTIPGEIYESAGLDGANKLQTLFQITIPMIKPAIMSVLTLGFVYTFKVFDLVWVMTKGGPVSATELVSTYAYRLSFEEFQFSKGAASANVLFLILLCVGFFYIKTISDDETM